jgi:hypothetical protein
MVGLSVVPVGAQEVSWRFSGSVREEPSGQPVAGVLISAAGQVVQTDTAGFFSVATPRVPLGFDTVRAMRVGFYPETRIVYFGCSEVVTTPGDLPICENKLDVWLRATSPRLPDSDSHCSVKVHVLSDTAVPLVAALIRLDESPTGGAVSDSDGVVILDSVPAGPHRISTELIGFFPETEFTEVGCEAQSEPMPLTFRLRGTRIW